MPDIVGLDWLNLNAQRNYPLSQEATGEDTGKLIRLPDNFIVDLQLNVPWFSNVDPTKFHVSTVSAFSQGVVINFGYNGELIATSEAIPSGAHTTNASYLVEGQGNYTTVNGVVTVGSLDDLLKTAPGVVNFDVNGGRLESTVVNFGLRGVSSIRIRNGNDLSPPMTGNVVFQAGTNVILETILTDNAIRIGALNGEGLQPDCTCDGQLPELEPIKTINGVTPDVNGNIELISGGGCLSIDNQVAAAQIVFRDTCSTPCCGCEELQIIVEDLKQTRTDLLTLQNIVSRLDGSVTGLANSFFGSVINAGSCVTPCP